MISAVLMRTEEHALEITANVMGQLCEIFSNSIMYKWPLILAVMRSETTELGDCSFADKKLQPLRSFTAAAGATRLLKQKYKSRTKAETSKRCNAQGNKYLSLQKGYIKPAKPEIIGLDLHSISSLFYNAY